MTTLDILFAIVLCTWILTFLYRGFKARSKWKKELAEEGEDWKEYDEERIAFRNLARSLGLKFLIPPKYRDLDE